MSDMKFNYSQKMTQQLRMSAQMIQSISLIKLSSDELCERIYEEAAKNPAIEIVRDAFLEHRPVRMRNKTHISADDWQAFLENAPAHSESLQEHLLFQLSLLPLTDNERCIGEKIIQNLDSHGFHTGDPQNILSTGESVSLMKKMLDIIRSLDPPGTACENIQESLCVQARLRGNAPAHALILLTEHFNVLKKKQPSDIAKYLQQHGIQCTGPEAEKAVAFIRTLEPYPARQFDSADNGIQYVVPEVSVNRVTQDESENNAEVQNGGFVTEFLRGNLPDIEISSVYTDILNQKNISKSEKEFASEAVKHAGQFIHALEYRSKSLYKTIQAIVTGQYEFFDKGPGHIIPLRLKDIADKIGVHETTVSRISNGKYLQCEWGIFEIKYFFSNAVQNKYGDNNFADSKESIKHQLLLILKENEKSNSKQLSDSALAALLAEKGIHIARRTVAKYRSELHINSSFDRN
ncbi:MAG: RNA polymerase factor sigma-54 [Spirochaetales bacterium]